MSRNQALKLIDKAFWRVAKCCECHHEWDRYLALHEAEEKGHRRFKPADLDCGLTKAQSVRLFAVKEIFERLVPAHPGEKIFTPDATDYFRIRGSVFAACAIVHMCGLDLVKEFSEPEMVEWLNSIDYAELNKDPHHMEAA